eukprot:1065982-Rhodomonas_salina.2
MERRGALCRLGFLEAADIAVSLFVVSWRDVWDVVWCVTSRTHTHTPVNTTNSQPADINEGCSVTGSGLSFQGCEVLARGGGCGRVAVGRSSRAPAFLLARLPHRVHWCVPRARSLARSHAHPAFRSLPPFLPPSLPLPLSCSRFLSPSLPLPLARSAFQTIPRRHQRLASSALRACLTALAHARCAPSRGQPRARAAGRGDPRRL